MGRNRITVTRFHARNAYGLKALDLINEFLRPARCRLEDINAILLSLGL